MFKQTEPLKRFEWLLLSLFLGLIMNPELRAQDFSEAVSAPLPPNAAEMARYGDVPVDLATGVPGISVPLFSVPGRMLELPLSVSYHAGGIQVNQEATWVGLGWNLQAGGRIVRKINGIADDYAYGYNNLTVLDRLINPFAFSPGSPLAGAGNEAYEALVYDPVFAPDPISRHDTEPDVFQFDCMGHAGKFTIRNNVPIMLTAGGYHITYLDPNGFSYPAHAGFEITGPDGTRFLFEEYEETLYEKPSQLLPPQFLTTSWLLTKVYNAKGQIEFEFTYGNQPQQSVSTSMQGESYTIYYYKDGTNYAYSAPGHTPPSPSVSKTIEKVLSRIESPEYRIDFDLGATDREDLIQTQYPLEYLTVRNRKDPAQIIKKWQFEYGYFNDQAFGPAAKMKRLRLDKIVDAHYPIINGDEFVFSFQYNESQALPHKESLDQDHWGYYNQRGPSTPTALPFTPFAAGLADQGYSLEKGYDRSPEGNLAQLGMLEKIVYPTGGSTEFFYELNTYKDDLDVNPEYEVVPGVTHTAIADRQIDGGTLCDTRFQEVNFSIPSDLPYEIPFSLHTTLITADKPYNVPGAAAPFVKLFRLGDQGELETLIFELNPGAQLATNVQTQHELVLSPGTYRLYAETCWQGSYAEIGINIWNADLTQPLKGRKGPGFRIAQMIQHAHQDAENDPGLDQEIFYRYEDENGYSSGEYALNLEDYLDFFTESDTGFIAPYTVQQSAASRITVRQHRNIFKGLPLRNPLRYSRVEVRKGMNGEGGKAISSFEIPLPEAQFEAARISQMSQYAYEPGGNDPFRKISESLYDYGPLAAQSSYRQFPVNGATIFRTGLYKAHLAMNSSGGQTSYMHTDDYTYDTTFYQLGILWKPLLKKTDKVFDPNGAVHQTITEYAYDPLFLQQTEEAVSNSDGSQYLTETRSSPHFYFQRGVPQTQLQSWLQARSDAGTGFMQCYENNGLGSLNSCEAALIAATHAANNAYQAGMTSHQLALDGQINNATDPALAALYKMQALHIQTNPVEVLSWKVAGGSTALLNARKTDFAVLGGGEIVPKTYRAVHSVQPVLAADFHANPDQYYEIEGTFTQFDGYGNISEAQPEDGMTTAYIWSKEGTRLAAKAIHASLDKVAFTSFEDPGLDAPLAQSVPDGGWEIVRQVAGGWSTQAAHTQTGQYGFHLLPGTDRFVEKTNVPAGKYLISFWHKGAPVEISLGNGGTYYSHQGGDPGEMTYFALELDIPAATTLSVRAKAGGQNVYLDELRLHPLDAQMLTYTYDATLRLKCLTDTNGRSQYFTYDSTGRLLYIQDQEGNYIKGFSYNMAQ